jgi:hypothetical protein
MKSNSAEHLSPVTTRTVGATGDNSNTVYSMSRRNTFTVTNGELQGNFSDPNPIFYKRTLLEWLGGEDRSQSVVPQYGAFSYYSKTGPQLVTGLTDMSYLWEIDFGSQSDEVMGKIYDSLRGSSNMIVDLAEGGQTIKMIRDVLNFKKLAKNFFTEVVRGKAFGKTRGQARLDYVTSKWLEYRYGWLPLMSSIHDVGETLAKRRVRPLYIKHRASRLLKTDGDGGLPWYEMDGDGSYSSPRIVYKGSLSYRTEMAISFNPPTSNTQQLADWTSLNPLGIAWELLPLSFVADWFINVGDQLAQWENWVLYSSNFRGGYKTTTIFEDIVLTKRGNSQTPFEYSPNGNPKSGFVGSSTQTWHRRIVEKNRSILYGLPTPAGLRIKANLNSNRLLDACALVQQVFVGGLRRMRF